MSITQTVTESKVVETPTNAMPVPEDMESFTKENGAEIDQVESVVTGIGVTTLDEPQITPIRSPALLPRQNSPHAMEQERGRLVAVQEMARPLSKSARRRRKKQNKLRPLPIVSLAQDEMQNDSSAEDSETSSGTPKLMSPIPRFAPIVGATLGSRPGSPGISALRAQIDAMKLRSESGSRSTSQIRSRLGSETPSTVASDHFPDEEDFVSYEIPIEQDFIDEKLEAASSATASTVTPDQKASAMFQKMAASDFTPLTCLGSGAFGTVYLVRQNTTGRLFAQKQLTKASLTIQKKKVAMTKSERSILELVNRQPFIVNLYYAFQDREKLYLILEYAQGGELFRHLELEKFFTEDTAAFYMAEIVLALDYLHNTVGVIYRDLKPENCLLDADGHLLLTDFGLSKVAVKDPSTPGGSRCNSLNVGTTEYMAPEIIRGSEISDLGPGYGQACDWWSLGAMGCDLMTGKPPFSGPNLTKLQQNIMSQKLKLPYYLSPDAKDLLTRLLRKEPSKRLGIGKNDLQTIKNHRFFRKIDWKQLERREIEPPIKPLITDPELAENFSPEFTSKKVEDDSMRSRTLSKSDPFNGFSFVASRSLLQQGFFDAAMQDGDVFEDEEED